MAKNYGKKNVTRRSSLPGQILLVFLAFFFGYLSASFYDFNRLSVWMNTHVLAEQRQQKSVKAVAQQTPLPKPKFEFYTLLANEKVAGAPSPTGSQPTRVAQMAGVVPQPNKASQAVVQPTSSPQPNSVAQAEAVVPINLAVTQTLPLHAPLSENVPVIKASNPVLLTKDSYLIQVGSFKNLREAERMKASLVMKGFDVKIASITQQRMNWYRVIIGPFASRTQALKAQIAFARSEHITGMIRRMDA